MSDTEDLFGEGLGLAFKVTSSIIHASILHSDPPPPESEPHWAHYAWMDIVRHLILQAVLMQPLVAPQVPGVQGGVFTSSPELIACDVNTAGPIGRDLVFPGGKTAQRFIDSFGGLLEN